MFFVFKNPTEIQLRRPTTPSSPILIEDTPVSGLCERQDPSGPTEHSTQDLRAVAELCTPGNHLLGSPRPSSQINWTDSQIQRWDENTIPLEEERQPAVHSKKQRTTPLKERVRQTYNYSHKEHEGLLRRSRAQIQTCRATKSVVVNHYTKLINTSLNQVRKSRQIQKQVVQLKREVRALRKKNNQLLKEVQEKIDIIFCRICI